MILAVPKNTLTSQQKANLAKKGYTVIECDDPDKIRVITPESTVDTNDYFMSALYALTVSTPTDKQEVFVNQLYSRLSKKST